MEKTDRQNDQNFQGGIFSGTRPDGQKTNRVQGINNNESGMSYPEYHRVPVQHNRQPVSAPYRNCYERCPYVCRNCRVNGKDDHTALIVAVTAMVFGVLIAFILTLFCITMIIFLKTEKADSESTASNKHKYEVPYQAEEKSEEASSFDDWTEKKPKASEKSAEMYYSDIEDAVRTDLDYSVTWENYEYEGNTDKIMIAVDYPVISGDIPNVDIINDVIDNETTYFEEYYKEYSQYMLPDEKFGVYAEGFVTYMDEEVMSVVFRETIYTDYVVDCGLYCVNIDTEKGIVLDNKSIIKTNDEFAVDFRTRSREQNGDIEALDRMTDQELALYLSNAGTSILFYTPLGMEVGINLGETYVTVTYEDYENYLIKY